MSELFSWAVVGPYTSARNIYWMKMCLKMPDQSEQTNRFSSARGKQARSTKQFRNLDGLSRFKFDATGAEPAKPNELNTLGMERAGKHLF